MKKILVILTAILLVVTLVGCDIFDLTPTPTPTPTPNPTPGPEPEPTPTPDPDPTPEPQLKTSTVRAYSVPQGVAQYAGAEVFVDGHKMPTYQVMVNTSQTWTPNNYVRVANGVCLFQLDGTAQVTVKPKTKIDYTSVIRPKSAKMTAVADLENNTLTFTVKSAGEYVLEVNANPYDAIHFFVSNLGEGALENYSGYDNVVVFDAGLHTAANDNRINSSNTVTVSSNTLVYLADGAVVRGKFVSNNANHVAIVGNGVIDGSTFERDAQKGTVTVPLDLNYCKDVLLENFTVLDPAGWVVSSYFVENANINNIKMITSRSNGDGISLQSNKNVAVDGCFVRTWDDSLVVKNYPRWNDRSAHGSTENITFTNCTVWTDLAQSMELGYETVGTKFTDVTFQNITVLHARHLAVMSIHNANNAEIQNVKFKDITIEEAASPAAGIGILDFRVLYSSTWSDQHTVTALGNVNGVTVENVKVLQDLDSSAKKFSGTFGGCYDDRDGYQSEHFVSNVTIKNVDFQNTRPDESQCAFKWTNQNYVRNFTFTQDQNFVVTGAQFIFSQTADYLEQFGTEVTVII